MAGAAGFLGDSVKIAVLGLGYVGCTAVACIASQGHEVVGIDVSAKKVEAIAAGISPIREPGIDTMLVDAHAAGLLSAAGEVGRQLDDCDIAIVCVGTTSGPDGSHNMSYIAQVTRQIDASTRPDRAATLTVV